MPVIGFVAFVVVIWLFSCLNVLNEYERGVIFRLGKLLPAPKGPGLVFVWKPIDRMVRVSLRTVVLGLSLLAISVLVLLTQLASVQVDATAVLLVLLLAAGAALVAGAVAAAVRESRGGPGA